MDVRLLVPKLGQYWAKQDGRSPHLGLGNGRKSLMVNGAGDTPLPQPSLRLRRGPGRRRGVQAGMEAAVLAMQAHLPLLPMGLEGALSPPICVQEDPLTLGT